MFEEIISLDNLLSAWQEFVRGKRGKTDIQQFERELMDNILQLQAELASLRWRHGSYHGFRICDPKPRHIHKASVRDRLVHHAIHRVLYPFFDRKFISDSFSCRVAKGVHAAGERFRHFSDQVGKNNTRTTWVLKCDIRKFFASISHRVLTAILERDIPDTNALWLLGEVIDSFKASPGRGLPLGNLTSQLMANIYLNELDQFVKHSLRFRHYIRYADDFVFLGHDREPLIALLPDIEEFLKKQLSLQLHPDKIVLKTLASGVDFLGWTYFPTHKVVRTVTRRRMMRRIARNPVRQTIDSYLGLLAHGDAFGLRSGVRNNYVLYLDSFADYCQKPYNGEEV